MSLKRPRPSNPRSPSSKDVSADAPTKWDVDRWRKGKRARRESTVSCHRPTWLFTPLTPCRMQSPAPSSRGPCLFGSSSVFRNELGPVPSLGLPSTSDAFDFFPGRPRDRPSTSYGAPHIPERDQSTPVGYYPQPTSDVGKLRSDAFCELQRSVAESGEGLVSRMRDWEESRTSSQPRFSWSLDELPSADRSRNRPAFSLPSGGPSLNSARPDDDEDDIQIVSGQTHSSFGSPVYPLPRKPRAFSMGDMDVDGPENNNYMDDGSDRERPSSPLDTAYSAPSGYASEEESPALSYTFTNSSNSSLVSLHSHRPLALGAVSSPTTSPSPSGTPSEKAIAALSLVMANGAGGISDYEAVRALEGQFRSTLDESHVGEMWN